VCSLMLAVQANSCCFAALAPSILASVLSASPVERPVELGARSSFTVSASVSVRASLRLHQFGQIGQTCAATRASATCRSRELPNTPSPRAHPLGAQSSRSLSHIKAM